MCGVWCRPGGGGGEVLVCGIGTVGLCGRDARDGVVQALREGGLKKEEKWVGGVALLHG